MDSEQLQNFHERLSQWVSSQGFWFQLRYSFSGVGSQGALAYHLMKMTSRILLFGLIVLVGFGVYLFKKPKSVSYRQNVQASLQEKFAADEIQMQGLKVEHGEFQIQRLAMIGGDETFFTDVELKNLRCRRSITDDFKKDWNPGVIDISRVVLGIRAGADSQESAAAIHDTIFQDIPNIAVETIKVADMSVRWGYSNRTKGSIVNSKMTAQKTLVGWTLKFRGGYFSQNWMKRLEIEELDVTLGADGVGFDKAVFRKGDGWVVFEQMSILGGQRPAISGDVKLRKISVSDLVPVAARNLVEGTLSGTFKAFGSTNSREGVGLKGEIAFEGEDTLILRDGLPLLKALSVVDAFNTYRRLDFNEGSFKLSSHNGEIKIDSVNLRAGQLFSMKGNLLVRPASNEELDAFNEYQRNSLDNDGILNDDELSESIDLTLRGAAESRSSRSGIGFKNSDDDSLFDRLGISLEKRREDARISETLSKTLQYVGQFEISLPKNAFLKSPGLAAKHPVSAETDRVQMSVPIQGTVTALTRAQAEEIYKEGAR